MPVSPMLNEQGAPHHHSSVIVQDGQVIGLTKLEHFAGLAMKGLLSNIETKYSPATLADVAFEYANAMLDRFDKAGKS